MSEGKPDYVSSITSRLGGANAKKGKMPKPVRIDAIARVVRHLHAELMAVEDVGEAIAAKDPRTIQSYVEVLARLKTSLVDLEEMVDMLHAVLFGDDGLVKFDNRAGPEKLLALWNSGKSIGEIAVLLDIQEQSVRNGLYRLRKAGRKVRPGPMTKQVNAAATGESR